MHVFVHGATFVCLCSQLLDIAYMIVQMEMVCICVPEFGIISCSVMGE